MRARILILIVVGLAVGVGALFLRPRDARREDGANVVAPQGDKTPTIDPPAAVPDRNVAVPSDAPPPSAPQPSVSATPSISPPALPLVPAQAAAPPLAGVPPTMAPLAAAPVVSTPPASSAPVGAISQEDILLDLDKVTLSLRDYRTIMRENPTGTNSEIVKALNGGNPKQAQLLQEGLTLNQNGELIDRWGTPYFFHQLSKDQMEIRSAGPDRQMWTEDDTKAN